MPEFWSEVLDVVLDALLDSLKALPFLFVSFLLIEWVEHRQSQKTQAFLSRLGKWSPIAGALVGLVPQCGFSVTAAGLYSGGIIGIGTVISVFFSTSDEALLLLFGAGEWLAALMLMGFKFAGAVGFGFLADFLYKKFIDRPKVVFEPAGHICEHCDCKKRGVFKAALYHTVKLFILLFVISLVLSFIFMLLGEDLVGRILLKGSWAQPFLTALFGFVPNCATSVFLTDLYMKGTLSFGAMLAGLSSGAGLGWIALIRAHWSNSRRDVFFILLFLYLSAALMGMVLSFFF